MEYSLVYSLLRDKQEVDYYANKIFEITQVMPAQCYLVNSDKGLYVRYPNGTDMNQINGASNLRKLKDMGIMPKLNPKQMEENTIFVNSAPKKIFTMSSEELTTLINTDNKNIIALNTFVPPPRIPNQNLGSIKITLSTRNMVHSALTYGLRILGCIMEPCNIRQGHYLKIPQCTFCYRFHKTSACEHINPVCPNCAQKHRRFQCPNKEGPWRCVNCKGNHKATSNYCPDRSGLLSEEPLGDINQNSLVCPFGDFVAEEQFIPAPQPNTSAWERNGTQILEEQPLQHRQPQVPQQPQTPLTNYHDCLRMALLYENWYPAFLILQPLLGLTRIELPEALRYNISIQESDILAPKPPPTTKEQPSNTKRENGTKTNNIYQSKSTYGTNWGPLTGANALPIAPRDNKEALRPPLLPTPSDPFQIPTYHQLKQGAIPKRRKPVIEDHPRMETSNRFAPIAIEEEVFSSPNILDEDEEAFSSSITSKNKPPLPKREAKIKQNKETSNVPPNLQSNKVDLSTNTNYTEEEDEELPSFWSTQDSLKVRQKPTTNTNSLSQEPSESKSLTPPPNSQLQVNTSISTGQDKRVNQHEKSETTEKPPNIAGSTTKGNPKENHNSKVDPKDRLSMSQPIMSTITEIAEPTSTISNTLTCRTSNEKTKETRRPPPESSHTEKLPFIVTRTPPDRRHTMGHNQFKSMVESFQNLSKANEETAKKIFTERRKAEQLYVETKKDYLKNTTNQNILQQIKDNTTSPHQQNKETPTEPHNQTHKEEIKFEMGVSGSPPPKIRKNYKHPSPPQDNSPPEPDNTTARDETETESSENKDIPKSTRLLRSNSSSHTKL